MNSKKCNITWYHTAHEWQEGETVNMCPGVWPHPKIPQK